MELLEELKKELEENIESEKQKSHTLETENKVQHYFILKVLNFLWVICL